MGNLGTVAGLIRLPTRCQHGARDACHKRTVACNSLYAGHSTLLPGRSSYFVGRELRQQHQPNANLRFRRLVQLPCRLQLRRFLHSPDHRHLVRFEQVLDRRLRRVPRIALQAEYPVVSSNRHLRSASASRIHRRHSYHPDSPAPVTPPLPSGSTAARTGRTGCSRAARLDPDGLLRARTSRPARSLVQQSRRLSGRRRHGGSHPAEAVRAHLAWR